MGTNGELVQAALAAIRTGDSAKAAEVVADDFVSHIPGTSTISGDARGVDEWGEKLQRLLGAGLQPELVEMLEGKHHVAAVQHNRASVNGHALDVRVVNLFSIANGKVARLDTFFADQPAAETFWNAAL